MKGTRSMRGMRYKRYNWYKMVEVQSSGIGTKGIKCGRYDGCEAIS